MKEDGVKVIAELLRDNNTLTETNIITYINDNKDSLWKKFDDNKKHLPNFGGEKTQNILPICCFCKNK